jgi:hypothetical protein
MALANAVLEEITNRAFPMMLWRHRSLAFRMFVPSVFFTAQHLVDEPFDLARFVYLISLGVVFSAAFAYVAKSVMWRSAFLASSQQQTSKPNAT